MMQDSIVEYRDIAGFPGYRVGSDGSVWSCRSNSGACKPGKWKRLRCTPKKGYPCTALMKSGKRVWIRVPRLVLTVFRGPCPIGMQACHGDGNKSNNNLWNLRWDSPKNNVADRRIHGTMLFGEQNPSSRLTDNEIREIRNRYRNGELQREIAVDYGVDRQYVSLIVLYKVWGHI